MGTNQKKSRVHAIISGRVQGVAYRWYTRDAATELGINGLVRNLANGSVELVAEGLEGSLKKLIDWCHKGPSMASVTAVETKWEESRNEFNDFSIRH
ncbi:MAG: acylphosphatase [Deltaproteobacteria bacterium]|nr:acylphosphatase [Deltaproteobacteria bacterium]